MNKCIDVSVRTGAKYNTDQLLVCTDMNLKNGPFVYQITREG